MNGCTPNFCGGIQRYQDIFVSLKKNAKGFKPSQLPSTIFCCNLASTGFFCVDPNLIDVFFFHRLYVRLRCWLLAFRLRVGGIWMHNLRYYVGSGDVPEQIQFDGGTYTCRCGQNSAKFWLMIFARLCFIVVAGIFFSV